MSITDMGFPKISSYLSLSEHYQLNNLKEKFNLKNGKPQ